MLFNKFAFMSRFFLKYLLLELYTRPLCTLEKHQKQMKRSKSWAEMRYFHFSHFCNQIHRRWRIPFVIYRMVSMYLLHLFAKTVYHAIIASHTIALFTIYVYTTIVMLSVICVRRPKLHAFSLKWRFIDGNVSQCSMFSKFM